MATKLYPTAAAAEISLGGEDDRHTQFVPGGAATGVPTIATVNGPTAGIENGAVTRFVTPQLNAVTISGTITFNFWGSESSMTANAGFQVIVERLDSEGNFISTIVNSEFGTELGTAASVNNWTATPTSTTLIKGDRLRVRLLLNDAGGTMVTGFTANYQIAGPTGGANGDSWVQFTETITQATTRFYLPSSGAAPVSPAFTAGWEETGNAQRLEMAPDKKQTVMTDFQITTLIAAGDTLFAQFVGPPMQAQTIGCYVKNYARAAAAVSTTSRIVLKVMSGDGGTLRGTLLAIADYSTATSWNATDRNKAFADGDVIGSGRVTCQDGDRLVLEIGGNHGAAVGIDQINFGDNSATDLAEDETTTTANNPWLELGMQILFTMPFPPAMMEPVQFGDGAMSRF